VARGTRHLPVVSLAAEHLAMGMLLRRSVLAYKAPLGHEGYDLICIHPNPRHRPEPGQRELVRVQVKSRYQSDSDRGVMVAERTLGCFDFLVAVLLNIGDFYGGDLGEQEVEFYTFPVDFVRRHLTSGTKVQRLLLDRIGDEVLEGFRGNQGFEQVAIGLGVERPRPTSRKEYWTTFVARSKAAGLSGEPGRIRDSDLLRWRLPGADVVLFAECNLEERYVAVSVEIERGMLPYWEERQSTLSAATDGKLDWSRTGSVRPCLVVWRPANPADLNGWPEQHRWLLSQMFAFAEAVPTTKIV
jgi:hypothetical protein